MGSTHSRVFNYLPFQGSRCQAQALASGHQRALYDVLTLCTPEYPVQMEFGMYSALKLTTSKVVHSLVKFTRIILFFLIFVSLPFRMLSHFKTSILCYIILISCTTMLVILFLTLPSLLLNSPGVSANLFVCILMPKVCSGE